MANPQTSDVGIIFGGVLQRYRAKAGVTQEELAFQAGVDRTFVSRLERGIRQPTITTLLGLGAALGISATELVRETEAAYMRGQPNKLRK